MRKDLLIGAGFIVSALLAVIAVVTYHALRPDPHAPKTIVPKYEPVALLPEKKETPKKPPEVVKKIAIRPISEKPATKEGPAPPPPKKEPPVQDGKLNSPPVAPPPVKVAARNEVPAANRPTAIVLGNITRLNNPEGDFTIKALNSEELILIGKIKTLTIDGANAAATLDASELDAQEIVVTGDINGKSRVLLHAPRGVVQFQGEVNGQPHIEVAAPEGKVVFKSSHASIINGESKVIVVAREVQFLGDINGTRTSVDVTLTAGGALKFLRLSGGVHLKYRRAAGSDPEPRMEAGTVGPMARFQKLDPGKQ